jgi:hypothetical protein
MAKVATLVVTTVPSIFPAGTQAGQWRFSVNGVGVAFSEEKFSDETKAEFGPLEVGDYIAHAVRMSAAGDFLGVEVAAEFSVVEEPETVTIDTADGLSVTLA